MCMLAFLGAVKVDVQAWTDDLPKESCQVSKQVDVLGLLAWRTTK
jgi:hypothetical protein